MQDKFSIVYSERDPAGMNIAEELKKIRKELNLLKVEKEIIYAENIDKHEKIKDSDFIIFASKHQSKKNIKSLSIHSPGNWGKAEFGGRVGKVCPASCFLNKLMFKILNEKANGKRDYEITLEVTHHGPYIEKPCLFIEIGSSEKEWEDKKLARIIAETIIETIERFGVLKEKWIPSIGIGSNHYCPNFNKIQASSNYALSHIIPNYVFPITAEMVREGIEKTKEKIEVAILDWKGMKSQERKEAIKILENFNIKYLRTDNMKKS